MGLKGFLADWAFDNQEDDQESIIRSDDTGKRIAVIGAGPAGLTAARDLVRLGHKVTVFDENPVPGGMMRVGIPPHRVSYDQLKWEIERILAEGVDLKLKTRIDDIPGLLNNGYHAVLAAAGAGVALKPDIKNADHKDNWLSLDFLKRVALGNGDDLTGRRVIVLGGGDVAMDAARSAIRLGADEVKILCRGIRASDHELQATIDEGIEIIRGRVFKEISLKTKKIEGVLCLEADVGEVVDGRRQFKEIPDTDHLIPGDLVIWALGQKIDPSFLPPVDGLFEDGAWGIQTDQHLMTTIEGLFAAGDFRVGNTTFVVDAVGEGHRAAQAIHHFLIGKTQSKEIESSQVILSEEEMQSRLASLKGARRKRKSITSLPVKDRITNFQVVDLGLGEKTAREEAGRCLSCGPCSECKTCIEICEPGAILLDQKPIKKSFYTPQIIHIQDQSVSIPGGIEFSSDQEPLAGSAAVYQLISGNGFGEDFIPVDFPQKGSSDQVMSRTGLIVCRCGGLISDFLDTTWLCEQASGWDEVVFTSELTFSCTDDGATSIMNMVKENKLDSILLAACSCCSLDQVCYSCTFQRTRCKENLGAFSSLKETLPIEFVNIREQCAWAHPRGKKKNATAAGLLIRSALCGISNGKNGKHAEPSIPKSILILGTGESANYCQQALDEMGLTTYRRELIPNEVVRTGGQYQLNSPDGFIQTDCLVLAPANRTEMDELSGSLTLPNQAPLIPISEYGKQILDFGLMICPPEMAPGISGRGAALSIVAWICRISKQYDKNVAVVDPQRCRACGTCQQVCGYGIPIRINEGENSWAYINPILCQDCGTCAAHCPSGAIIPGTHQTQMLEDMLERILE
jgi:NADPH-dependent glutamate synthase beta subunit-like oxidoreductase/Pyruvate/2-oxoacid:ferredoxin oxidoreductase delta subunit